VKYVLALQKAGPPNSVCLPPAAAIVKKCEVPADFFRSG